MKLTTLLSSAALAAVCAFGIQSAVAAPISKDGLSAKSTSTVELAAHRGHRHHHKVWKKRHKKHHHHHRHHRKHHH